MKIPEKISSHLTRSVRRFQKVLASAKDRDVNESDTVVIITDALSDLFGYDKYSEITTETEVRGTFCDLAIVIDGAFRLLIEVKAIGFDLKEHHIKQAIDYAANKGLDWVVLTNGNVWRLYRVHFTKPINHELVTEITLLTLNPRSITDIERLYLFSRHGLMKSAPQEYFLRRQTTNRYLLAQMLLGDQTVNTLRRDLRKMFPGIKVDIEEIRDALSHTVFKRELIEGDNAEDARRKVQRYLKKNSKTER